MQSVRARGGGFHQAKRAATKELYGIDEPHDRRFRPQVPAGAAAGRARRPLHPDLFRHQRRATIGTTRITISSARTHAWPARPTSPSPACCGPKARGLLDSHAGRLGRRVRPHAARPGRERPRPSPLRLHHVDGRRRHPRRPGAGRDRRVRRARRSTCPSTRTTSTPRILRLMGIDHEKLTYSIRAATSASPTSTARTNSPNCSRHGRLPSAR